MVLFPEDFKVSESLMQTLRSGKFEVRFDADFPRVMELCATVPRKDQEGTWITRDIIDAYVQLHELGFAHSVESYRDGNLVGGLYGVSLGLAFFGESMFFIERDASKVALHALVMKAREWGFKLIDAQQKTQHMKRLGAKMISRSAFLELLEQAFEGKTMRGKWD